MPGFKCALHSLGRRVAWPMPEPPVSCLVMTTPRTSGPSTDGLFDCLYLAPSILPVKTSGFLPPCQGPPTPAFCPSVTPTGPGPDPKCQHHVCYPHSGTAAAPQTLGCQERVSLLANGCPVFRKDGYSASHMDKVGFYFPRDADCRHDQRNLSPQRPT